MEPFTVRTTISQKEYTGIVMRKTFKNFFVILVTVSGIFMVVMSAIALIRGMKTESASTPVMQLGLGIFFSLLPVFTRLGAVRTYRSTPKLQQENEYTFTNEGIVIKGNTKDSTAAWSTIVKREELGNFILLFFNKTHAEIIRKDILTKEQLYFIRMKVPAR
ncbi:MAG TPA: YcxB family protein [Chitinophagaceae bacterium]|nr:YcxB family protein [Chitinophagaceae bacterium]